ncbi:MAG: YkvA family protein [Chloroflexota bacterium]
MSEEKPKRSIRNLNPPQTGVIQDVVQRVKLILRLMSDSRVSFWLKLIPIASIIYLFSPVDLAPGVVLPVVGALDDAAILWAGFYLFVELCPPDVVQEHSKALNTVIPGKARDVDEEIIDGESRDVD